MPKVYTAEELAACGTAGCGCWYAAEQGIPCVHDLALLESSSVDDDKKEEVYDDEDEDQTL